MCFGGSTVGQDARKLEQEQQLRIDKGLGQIGQIYSKFDPEFYKARQIEYENYAKPTLESEFAQMTRRLQAQLGGRGTMKSSMATTLGQSLAREKATKLQEVANVGLERARDIEANVAQSKANAIAQLQASTNPSLAAQTALAESTRFSAPPPMSPVGNFFNNWSNLYIADNLAKMYRDYDTRGQPNAGGALPGKTSRVIKD